MKRRIRRRPRRRTRHGLQHIGDLLPQLLSEIEPDENDKLDERHSNEKCHPAAPTTVIDTQNTFAFHQPLEI